MPAPPPPPRPQDLAASQDLKLSSCASRALLHIESATATQRPGLAGLALPLHALPAPLLPAEPPPSPGTGPGSPLGPGLGMGGAGAGAQGSPAAQAAEAVVAEVEEMLGGARHRMNQVRARAARLCLYAAGLLCRGARSGQRGCLRLPPPTLSPRLAILHCRSRVTMPRPLITIPLLLPTPHQVKRRLDRSLDAVRPPVPEGQRLVMQVGGWWG